MTAVIVLSGVTLYVGFLWLDSQLYSETTLPLPSPEMSEIPDIQGELLNAGSVQLSGPEIAQLIWLDKPPEVEALAVDIVENESWGPSIRVQSSLRIGEDETRPYLNIDVELGFLFEDTQFLNTHLHRCKLGQLDLSKWCKSAELDSEFNDRIQMLTEVDPAVESTVSLIQRAYIADNALVIELRQENLLRQVLDQLQNLDPSLLEELQLLEANPAAE